ncbi:alcohol acetyltransferase-domain-containing protein [Achaetomium macrosporum]|uniref:Alcohol acetyltransferase-domain-containing protein n=1 Tax=Achaetomium macrosporum TaxID=79813 RepID=A0AAN7CCD0_9PEZI|nr:alcohol acetyltransferase-domain-containing protein [Achaetomium macrosporum]
MDAPSELVRPLGPYRPIRDVLETAVANVVLAIPSLSVGIVGEHTSKPHFVRRPSIDLEDHIKFLEKPDTDPAARDLSLLKMLEDQHDQCWPDTERRPPWKLTVVVWAAMSEPGSFVFDAVFAVHHSIADGRSASLFHVNLLKELNRPSPQPSQLSGSILETAGVRRLGPPQEELVKFTLSWKFLLQTLWRELGPTWFRKDQNGAPWTGKSITREPCRTKLRLVTVPAVGIPRVLAACRANQTTLTPLLHALVLASLAKRVPREQAQAFRSSTPIDLRPFMEAGPQTDDGRNSFGVFVTAQFHNFDGPTLTAMREEPSEEEIWRIAADLRRSMKQHVDSVPNDDIMGLLGWVSDWQQFWMNKVGKPRQDTWEVSNIGSMPGGHEQSEQATLGWTIQRSIMSQGATVAGAAVNISAFGSSNGSASTVSLVQSRAKSNHLRPRDQGVVVRLLEDIPKFGRKDSIFRVERGRMRNEWYPHKKAEYMTASRFRELGLTRDDIGERDTTFGTAAAAESETVAEPAFPTMTVLTTSPEKAHTLLTTLIPETLTFRRKPIPAPTPAAAAPTQSISPLVASTSADTSHEPSTPLAIYGSVSATDIVGHIKALLAGDVDGSRIVLEPENIRFLGLAEEADRVKALGRWEVEISVGGTGLEPVRKTIEILPLSEGPSEDEAQPTS